MHFKIYFSRLFLNCGYLFCLTCKAMRKTMKEQREKRQRKKHIFNSKKKFGKGTFISDVCKKRLNFGTPPPSSPLSTNIQFLSQQTLLFNVLNWDSTHPPPPSHPLGILGIFLENFSNKINIVT